MARSELETSDLAPPEIKTARLVLRPFVSSDAGALFAVLSKWRDITPMIGWPVVHSNADAEALLKTMLAADKIQEQMFWAINVDGTLAGSVFFVRLDLQDRGWRRRWGMLGYCMAGENRNQGYITEATSAAMAYGFNELGLHKIKIGHVHVNDKSRRVIEKLGFRHVGVEQQEYCWSTETPPVWYDHHLYELLASEWKHQLERTSDGS